MLACFSHVRLWGTLQTLVSRLLCPWASPGKNTGVGCHVLLEGIFPTQGLNLGLLHCRQILYNLSFTTLASMVAQTVKNLPAMPETQIQSLGWEAPLEKEMATHSSILVQKIPWTEEPGGLPSMGLQRVRYEWETNINTLKKDHM